MFVAGGLDERPFLETEAKLERIGVPGGDEADATHIYVATLKLPHVGKYWMLAEPEGGKTKVQALGNVVVVKNDPPPDVGDPAIASDTPTLASRRRRCRGDDDPDTARRVAAAVLVADSLAAKVPFVVTFATPKFCSSRTCGPVVDVVEEVQHRSRARTSASSTSRCTRTTIPPWTTTEWMGEWNLPTEPWTFLVGSNGKIVDRFEGTVSVDELETAVREKLLASQ